MLTHEYWPASVTLVSLMMSFLFLPSSLICTLHVSYSRLEESFSREFKAKKAKRKSINTHLLSGTISWSPLNHFTSPPASSSSQTSVNVSFSTSCCDFNTFTNLYGYSAQRKRTSFLFFFSDWTILIEKNFYFFSFFTIETHLLRLEPFQFCPSVC